AALGLGLLPMGKVCAVEEDDSVRRRIAQVSARGDLMRVRPVGVVDVPFLAWEDRSVPVPLAMLLNIGHPQTGRHGDTNKQHSSINATWAHKAILPGAVRNCLFT